MSAADVGPRGRATFTERGAERSAPAPGHVKGKTMRRFSSSLLVSGVLALTVAGCGSAGGAASIEVGITAQALQTTAPSSGGSLATDRRHLVITVTEVDVHVAAIGGDDDDDDASGKSAGGSGWIKAFSGETKVDLLDAIATEALLGSITVPAGKITQVRLVLTDAELVDGLETTAVTCPSCSESGLKIVTEGKVNVAVGGVLHLALDFDQTKSLTQDEAGYRLNPVIKIATSHGK